MKRCQGAIRSRGNKCTKKGNKKEDSCRRRWCVQEGWKEGRSRPAPLGTAPRIKNWHLLWSRPMRWRLWSGVRWQRPRKLTISVSVYLDCQRRLPALLIIPVTFLIASRCTAVVVATRVGGGKMAATASVSPRYPWSSRLHLD
ncbi:hypothetical protein LSTR_LSTR002823 [Laodelphax striatellus]|uniref:Uncharacterized protein n=1 Tax=Laodelphax striatellus TaxID=195883 RepID=A0A482XIN0_LAOST|nr:hypothetical protein LSTR_LSTR002823 [Laodelphax striatellus]